MKSLLWVLTLFALAVGVSLAAHFNDGYVLLVLPPYRIELSFNLAVLLILGAFLVFYGLLRAVALTRSLPRRVRAFREQRQQRKMNETFSDAARLLFEGRFSHALTRSAEAHGSGYLPALAALLAARSAQRLGEPVKQKEWLERAVQADPKMQPACWMLEAEMLIELQRFDEAVAVLTHLHETAGRHIAALRLELRAQQGRGDLGEVQRITRLLENHEALPPV